MSKEPVSSFAPRQAYSDSLLDRAAHFRSDEQKLAAFHQDGRAGIYVVAGDNIVLKAHGETLDPLFSPAEARALGTPRETMFLGHLHGAPRFGAGLDPVAVEALKARNDLKLIDLRTIAVQGMVAAEHVPPLAEAFSGWRDSPPHRANMLNRGVSRLGIATAYAPGSKYKVFWALILVGPVGGRG